MMKSMPRENTIFDSLASQIPEDERKALFTRITESIQYSSGPFREADEDVSGSEYADIQESFARKGFWEHLVCAILGFFKRKKPVEMYQERLLNGLRSKIDARAANLVDTRQGRLTEGFLSRLERLKDASRFFYSALEGSLERDKGEFSAFLGSVYMEDTDRRLGRECDPYSVGDDNRGWDDQAVLRQCLESMDGILSIVPEERKKAMYRQFRTLFCLKRLASFPFDRFASAFEPDSAGRRSHPLALASQPLSELADVLASMYEPPPEDLLELMFLFPLQRMFKDDPAALESSIKDSMRKADAAVKDIRSFMADVPLVDLVRYARRELSYAPRQVSGGEDWFTLYKSAWKSRIEGRHQGFARDRKRMRLQAEVEEFLGGRKVEAGAWLNGNEPEALVVRHGFLFAFIETAFDTVFVEEVNRPLKIVIIDGQFFRQDNRLEFTDACNDFFKTPEILKSFQTRLSRKGDLGKLYEEARLDFASTGSKQNRILAAIQAASSDADRILAEFQRSVRIIVLMLSAISKPEPGARYESLQNLSTIDGRQNAVFRRSLDRARERLERFQEIIPDICDLDSIRLDI